MVQHFVSTYKKLFEMKPLTPTTYERIVPYKMNPPSQQATAGDLRRSSMNQLPLLQEYAKLVVKIITLHQHAPGQILLISSLSMVMKLRNIFSL